MSFDRVVELVRQSTALNGAAPAIMAEGRKALSYGELSDQVNRTARVLRALGVTSKDRVVVVGSSGAEMAVLALAIMAVAGCAPLNPLYTASEFEFYLKDIDPRLVITEGAPSLVLEVAHRLGIPTLEVKPDGGSAGKFSFFEIDEDATEAKYADPDDVGLILHTSGTTAKPKMVPLTQRNLCSSAFNVARSLALSPDDRCFNVMPLFHIHGLIGTMLATIASGGSVACPGLFRPPAFFDWLKEFDPTWYTASPSMHTAVLERAKQLSNVPLTHRLRMIRSSSAPLPRQVIAGLEEFFKVPLLEAYGMTEAAYQITCNPLPPNQRKRGSVGIPTGTQVAIMDATGKFAPEGVVGEIVARGENFTAGYLAAPEINAAAFTDGWFRTGDQGRFDEDGYLFITGRIKEIINRGGEKISPCEIDEVLLAHPGVAEAVAFALPDPRLGEEIGAAIVLNAGAEGTDVRSLLNFAAIKLAPFKLPRRIVFVSQIPRGPTGKPQRVGLAKRLGLEESAPVATSAPPTQPYTPTEQTLLQLCRDIFQLTTLGVNDNFFDSGADSLSALTLLLEIEHHWHITITIADMFSAPTVAEFAKIIDQVANGRQASQLAIIQAGGSLPPFFCLGAGPRYRELARLLGPEQPFFGPVYPRASELSGAIRIEDVAAHFVPIIRDAQPRGPYFLGGWCNDGLLAYEVAQQLRRLGEPVALVVMFDTSFYSSKSVVRYGHFRDIALDVARYLWALIRQQQRNLIADRLRGHMRGLVKNVQSRFDRRPARELQVGWMESAIQRRAAAAYRPLPYDGRVLHLQRSLWQTRWTRARQDWSSLARGGYETYDIPGDHVGMFEKPNVVVTAEKLSSSLCAAQKSFR